MEVSIPVLDSAPVQVAPAVVTPDEAHVASEPATPAVDAPSCGSDDDAVLWDIQPGDLRPSGKRYTSVADMVADLAVELRAEEVAETSRENTLGKERVGEEGEGDGRIGGTGERKEEGGEGEGGEENLEQFKCTDGLYSMPPNLYSDFCSAFGQTMVDRELTLARLWVETNPPKRKTRRGMGRFLNAWLCRSQGEKRQALKGRTGSLLDSAPSSQKGW